MCVEIWWSRGKLQRVKEAEIEGSRSEPVAPSIALHHSFNSHSLFINESPQPYKGGHQFLIAIKSFAIISLCNNQWIALWATSRSLLYSSLEPHLPRASTK